MKRAFALIAVGLMFLTSCWIENDDQPDLLVGVASSSINPSIGAFIAGDKQNRKFTAVRDSLYAKAVVMTNGDESISLVTIDCIGLMYSDVLKIRDRTSQICDFPKERIVVSSTHTHSGPDVVGIWGPDYTRTGVDSGYMEKLINTVASQVKKASENQVSVKAFVSETSYGDPWVENICKEEIDRSVSIIQFRDFQDDVVVTLSNFACHPTILDAEFSVVSADFVGGYYKHMRESTGAEALFLQGAIGGWIQPEGLPKSFESANQLGMGLADAVLSSLSNAEEMVESEISFNSNAFQFPVENQAWKQLSALGIINRDFGDSVLTEVSWFAIGNAQFATHPGETAPQMGLDTKQMMTTGPKFVLGLGNDALGYILKTSFFESDSVLHAPYLTSMSLGPETAPMMMEELEKIIPGEIEGN